MSEDPSVVQVRGLTKRFNGLTAVDNIDFDLRPHCTTALLGSNGAGKTTTISMLLGLLLPTNGSIRIFDKDLLNDRFKILPRINISSPYIDLPQRLTVRQNLTVYSRLYKVPSPKERIAKLSMDLELTEFIDRQVRKLSSGQKTRVSLAKALINEPELLLLDEPTASLDPETANWVRDYLRQYQKRRNTAILLASHNMLEVERMCQHVYIMSKGRIVEQGSPAQLINRHEKQDLEEVFLKIARN
jgi:ABC-2 type transport system ATP-binding protein